MKKPIYTLALCAFLFLSTRDDWSGTFAQTYCSGTITLTAPSGTLSDGSSTNNYGNNSDCKWLIQSTGANSITLDFSSFSIESGYDFVKVYSGGDTLSPLLGVFTGNNLPPSVTSGSGMMLVRFITDATYSDSGWVAYYTSFFCSLSINATKTNITCYGASNGTATVPQNGITGGISPYTYQWSNGATQSSINNLHAASYSVTVTDNNGCTATTTITINEPSLITVSATATAATCNGCSNGSANLTITGGTPPYTYNWSNSATTQDISNLSAGNYTVTTTDNNNCSANATVTITEPPAAPYCSNTAILTSASDTFSDGSGANDYANNSNCKWLIIPSGAMSVILSFNSFSIESGYDFVKVYNGADTLSTLLGTFTGNDLPASVTSTTGTMLVHFTSDYAFASSGWGLSYTSVATGISEQKEEAEITIFPNPFSIKAMVQITNNYKFKNTVFTMYNILGEEVLQSKIINPQSTIQRGNLLSGIYYYRIIGDEQIIHNGKLTIQ